MLWTEDLTVPVSVVLAEADSIVNAASVYRYLQRRPPLPPPATTRPAGVVHITTFPDAGHADFLNDSARRRRIVARIAAHLDVAGPGSAATDP